MNLESHIGARIRQAREHAGLTLEGLGRALGTYLGRDLTAQAVWQMEKGMRDLKAVQIVALCLALDLPIAYLFAASDDEPITLEDGGKFEYKLNKSETDRVLRPTGHVGGYNQVTYDALVGIEKTIRAAAAAQTASNQAFMEANHVHEAVLALLNLGGGGTDD
jgi:transcriptional regulator with XRE-family HTH domain